MLERQLQNASVAWLRSMGFLFISRPEMDMKLHGDKKERAIQMAKFKARGASLGFPDLFIFCMGSTIRTLDELKTRGPPSRQGARGFSVGGLAVELKVGNNPLTPAQVTWREQLRDAGYAYVVVRSLRELQDKLDAHQGGVGIQTLLLWPEDDDVVEVPAPKRRRA